MIYTGLNHTGEISKVYAHGDSDVSAIYGGINEANPIYYKTRTITGQTPLSYKALSKPISDYIISGNTLQDGTPTPEAPVDAVGCGTWDETQQSYKLPLTVNGAEYPIYLGQVPTTRRVKKLVLDGTEDWNLSTINTHGIANFWFRISDRMQGPDGIGYCSHYEKQTASGAAATTEGFFSGATDALYIRVQSTTADTVEKFKDYISGKGVTIWYVMSEPETGIVNEPLQKIGDYADTISFEQAGVTIPTVAGANTLTIDTTVQPSAVSITGNIKEVST